MFFKREKERVLGFSEQMDQLRAAGFSVEPASNGLTRVSRGHLAALLKESAQATPTIVDTGLLVGQEIAVLTDIGFQKIFLTPSGRRTPALAEHLKALHDFKEDLGEALGLTSLYNEGLGTTNEKHLYDRVEHRDEGVRPRPWERN
jgi:hypothetical protein